MAASSRSTGRWNADAARPSPKFFTEVIIAPSRDR